MPKLLQINVDSALYSCGKICEDISVVAKSQGWVTYIAYGRERKEGVNKEIKIGSWLDVYEHYFEHKLFDREGMGSRRATKHLVKKIKEINPDIIHLHLIHDHYLNYKILFSYLSTVDTPVVWTQHDSWNITGHCYHFVSKNCDKWKTECNNCPLIHDYPFSLIDRSKSNYQNKKRYFNIVSNLTIVSCSHWLDQFIGQSFLKDNKHVVIHNGVDLTRFKPTREKVNNKFRIIGVALPWSKAKGIDDFYNLRNNLPESEYEIIMVGLNKKQIGALPSGIIGIEKTHNVEELVDLYSSSHVFVNTTYADNFPTTNIEALACGTPVITYKTGGAPEAIDEQTGVVVEQGDVTALTDAIVNLKKHPISSVTCRERAEQLFNKDNCFRKYIELYNDLLIEKENGKNINNNSYI